jgi:hypothetical protein
MQTEKRLHAAVMTEHLLAAPYPYRFAQLLNVLGRMLRNWSFSMPKRSAGSCTFVTACRRLFRPARSRACKSNRSTLRERPGQPSLTSTSRRHSPETTAEFDFCLLSRSSKTCWLP